MKDSTKRKKQLIAELEKMRHRVAELEPFEAKLKQAEKTLKAKEKKLRQIYNEMPLGYQSLDNNGNIITVNRAWFHMLGYPKRDVIGRWFGEFLTDEYVDLFKENYSSFKEKREVRNVEFEMIKKNGSHIHISFDSKIEHDENGNLKETHCIIRDIKEYKKKERLIAESEERYRMFFENSTDFIYTCDLEGNFTNVNAAAELLTGYTKDELIGMNFKSYTSQDTRRRLFRAFNRVFRTGEPLKDFMFCVVIKDGTKKYFETSVTRLLKDDEIIGFQGSSRDITNRKHAEEKLRESEERFRAFMDHFPAHIYIKDEALRHIFGNRALLEFVGKSLDEVIGTTSHDFFPEHIAQKLEKIDREVVNSEQVYQKEFSITLPTGEISWKRDIKFLLRGPNGEKLVSGISVDITERKKAEEELRQSEERLSEILENSQDAIYKRNLQTFTKMI